MAIDAQVEEVRLAIALNGGVSLAVWMGGCAVELDCARRAHTCIEEIGPPPRPLTGTRSAMGWALRGEYQRPVDPVAVRPRRSIYNALCKAFRRELVIDVMSGASAGGINGALLAAAIRNRRRLHPDFIRGRWLDLGELADLLHRTSNPAPTSLMQGSRFHAELEKAFGALLGAPDAEPEDLELTSLPPNQDELASLDVKLDVTVTDVRGRARPFLDSTGRELVATEYRAPIKFRDPPDFTVEKLSAAARSSASFPLAFEPFELAPETGGKLAGLSEKAWVIDGGLLDNAPIRAALELIPTRPMNRAVRRWLYYVNADPPQPLSASSEAALGSPDLEDMIGYVAALPRKATFVDQASAIERALRRAVIVDRADLHLLTTDLGALTTTAEALLPAYRSRQRFFSLEQLLGEPNAAKAAFERLAADQELPWIPTELTPPAEGEWPWATRAAERILFLLVDLIRDALIWAPTEGRELLLEAQATIDDGLKRLGHARAGLVGSEGIRGALRDIINGEDPNAELAALTALANDHLPPVREIVREAAAAAFRVSTMFGVVGRRSLAQGLFGESWVDAEQFDDALFDAFLRRALAIEVLRRTFMFSDEESDSGQQLNFAQLTPFAPGLIFSDAPLSDPGPASAEEKLTGIKLGHFAGFYRRSWRANDFMWGRLDAAAQIVGVLVDPIRAAELVARTGELPWRVLSDALLDGASNDARWLIHEALSEGFDGYALAGEEAPTSEQLAAHLPGALELDLVEGEGKLTRAICTRAAQLEIAAHELPILDAESRGDAKLGSAGEPLGLPIEGGLRPAIESIRESTVTLPRRLGRDSRDELASNLGVRTLTHAALVAIAMLRAAKIPLARFLNALRAFVLPIAGVVSKAPGYRAAVVLAVWAAAMYLATRFVTVSEGAPEELGMLWSKPMLVGYLALLIIAGAASVPVLRATLSVTTWRRFSQGAWAIALLLTSVVAGLILALTAGHLAPAQLLAAPWPDPAPGWILWSMIVLAAGTLTAFGPLKGPLNSILERPWAGWPMLLLVVIVLGALAWWSIRELPVGESLPWWKDVTVYAAVGATPLCTILYLFLRQPIYGLFRR